MPFPSDRFRRAGATPAELDALELEHNSLPESMQAVNERHFDSLDTAGLAQALDVRRAAGLSQEAAPLPDAESLEELAAGATVEVNGEPVDDEWTIETVAETDEERDALPKLDEHPDPDAKPVAGRAKPRAHKPKAE